MVCIYLINIANFAANVTNHLQQIYNQITSDAIYMMNNVNFVKKMTYHKAKTKYEQPLIDFPQLSYN